MIRFRPKLRNSTTTVAVRLGCAGTLLGVMLWAPNAFAYPSYDDGLTPIGSGAGCVDCHNGFAGGSGALHTTHKTQLAVQSCNLCHPSGGGTTPVLTYSSGSGGGLGCAGCHGRNYGETSPNSGQPKSTAYGLRQVHANAGVTECATCHQPGALGHPSPFPAVLSEDILPEYYNPTFSNLTDSCSSTEEDMTFDVDSIGLDNDGDGSADGADSDCAVAGTPTATPTASATPTATVPFACGSAPIDGCIVPDKAVLLVNEKKSGKEKVKVVLKKLQPAVAQGQFGDPFTGGTDYKICIYNELDQLTGEYTPAGGGALCGGVSCWSKVSDKGYKYTDKTTSSDGILKVKVLGGDAGKGKVLVIGKNNASKGQTSLPTGVAGPLQGQGFATVQVLTSDASCFGTTVSRVKKADGLIFKALKGPFDSADGINGGLMYDKFWTAETGFDQGDPNVSVFDANSDFFRCKQCHAWDRLGNTASYINRAPSTTRPNVSNVNLAAVVQALSPQDLFDAIATGSGAPRRAVSADLSSYDPAVPASTVVGDQMPDFGVILTDEQIWDLVRYLKLEALDTTQLYAIATVGTYPTGSRTFSDIGRDGDAVNGDALYAGTCAVCHGADGTGGAFSIDGGAETVGSLLRNNPYETWHKVRFGNPGTAMGPQGIDDVSDLKDLYKALTNSVMYPDPTP